MFRRNGLLRRGGLSGLSGLSGRSSKTTKGGVVKIRDTYPANWESLRLSALARDNYRCRRCNANLRGVFYREVHHILPLSRGGRNVLSNLLSLCCACHERQH